MPLPSPRVPARLDDLPTDRPFRWSQAYEQVGRRRLHQLTRSGDLRKVVRGVWVCASVPDSLQLRVAALALVVPDTAVVTDRTAAWLHGVPILPRSAVHEVPDVSVFHRTDTRVRRDAVDAGRRELADRDVVVLGDRLAVTTPLRTACDLARLLWRYDALAAVDGCLRLGVDKSELADELRRFRGYRGVRQARVVVGLGDGRAESPGESALRLHWIEAGLPAPQLQIWVPDGDGEPRFRLDLGLEEEMLAAEYDGVDHHSSALDVARDEARRDWLSGQGWRIEVFDKEQVYGVGAAPGDRLRTHWDRSRRLDPRMDLPDVTGLVRMMPRTRSRR